MHERVGVAARDPHRGLARQRRECLIERLGQPGQPQPGGLGRGIVGFHVPREDAVRGPADETEPARGEDLAVDDERDGDEHGGVLPADVDARLDALGQEYHRRLGAVVEGDRDTRRDDLLQHVPQQRGVDALEVQPGVAGVVGEVEPVQGGERAEGVALARGAGVVRVRQGRPGAPALHPATPTAHDHEPGVQARCLRARGVAGLRQRRLDAQLEADLSAGETEGVRRRGSRRRGQLRQPR